MYLGYINVYLLMIIFDYGCIIVFFIIKVWIKIDVFLFWMLLCEILMYDGVC